ncbi:hypothetical protein IWX90DRAFT_93077 [Phyllosticta citrichinensis]|uniref:Uncharacterized protein n=1 Tax=Phyllosticta citrichinensis TaxID=1130410 RepID=A0ABR1XFG9_9PEZI
MGPNLPASLGRALALCLDVRGGVRLVLSDGAETGGVGGQDGSVGFGDDRVGRLVADAGRRLALDARDDLGRRQDLGVGRRDDLALGGRLDDRLGDCVRLGHDDFGRVRDRDDRRLAVDARLRDDLRHRLGFGHDNAGFARRVDRLDFVGARRLGGRVGLRRWSVGGRRFRLGLAWSGGDHGAESSQCGGSSRLSVEKNSRRGQESNESELHVGKHSCGWLS